MIRDITAKTLLSSAKRPDPWFGIKYTMNLYRGCQHQCIYCDSRSECYRIENFADVLVKVNAIDLLKKELPRKRVKGTIGTGSMSDPYLPLEAERRLTRQALEVIAQQQFPVHVITKSDRVTRDIDLLREISRIYAAVSFTITTADDDLGKKLEPGAPIVSRRLVAMQQLAEAGIMTGVMLMPVLPFLEDNADNIAAIVTRAHECGASYILAAFGMTLRDRQRAYYYAQLDRLFPGLRPQYERRYGQRYSATARNPQQLEQVFNELCTRYGVATRMRFYEPPLPLQPALL
jgi:DNA repair photolyase